MNKRRVVVTGVGVVAAPGVGMDDLWKGLQQQPPAPGPYLVNNWDPEPWIPKREHRRIDRFTQFALVATHEALEQSGQLDIDPNRVTVAVATGIGGLESLEELIGKSAGDDPRVSPFLIPMMMANAAAAAISIKYSFGGQVSTPVVACAAGSQAILDGLRQIQWGYADAAVVGGAEAAAARIPAREGFKAARALSSSGIARPFDVDRDGFVMGEGAGIMILEAAEVAEVRGAKVLAELRGGASTADAHHITAPHPQGDGAERAIRLALADSELAPTDVTYINAHGTGTDLNDRTEGSVIDRIFETQPAVSSIKGTTGHALGASGSIEAAVIVEAIRRSELPPNIGLTNQDPEIPLDDIVREPREWVPSPAITNSFGFGGHNTVLAFTPL